MLNRLPPRVHMFVRQLWFSTVGYLAACGAIALYKGDVALMWPPIIGLLAGICLACLTLPIPRDINEARARAHVDPLAG